MASFELRLLNTHDQKKNFTRKIVDNLMGIKFEKNSQFYFWVIKLYKMALRPIEINGNLHFSQPLDGEISQTFI